MEDRETSTGKARKAGSSSTVDAQSSTPLARWTVLYSGHVQGVGFRYTTQSVASGFAITGYVRNRSDGRVELVAEGAAGEVERFVQAIADEMGGYIHGRELTQAPATGEFSDFGVRR
jgi:acylphosphatase